MGNLEYIDELEAHIDELGNEIDRIKKASDYLILIEQLQSDINYVASTLGQSKDQLKLYQEIMESKLELFQTTARNIEAKQQSLEHTQTNIVSTLLEINKQQEAMSHELTTVISATSESVTNKHTIVLNELSRVNTMQNEQSSSLAALSKANKFYFISTVAISSLLVIMLMWIILK